MSWIVKLDKDDFVGKWALPSTCRSAGRASGSSASRWRRDAARRGRAGRRRRPAGRARHERARQRARRQRRSASRGCSPSWPRRARDSRSASDGGRAGARHARAVLRPGGRAAALVSRLAFLSPRMRRQPRGVSPLAPRARRRRRRRLAARQARGARPLDGSSRRSSGAAAARARRARCSSSDGSPRARRCDRLRGRGVRAYDVTAALAGVRGRGRRRSCAASPSSTSRRFRRSARSRAARGRSIERAAASATALRRAGARPLRRRGRPRRAAGARPVKDIFRVRRMWRPRGELKRRYDVVIIGGGSHGLATAYYLAKNHGIRNVAVLEQSYIGSGAAGRNTTIIRSNYRTPEGAAFYKRSVELYEGLVGRPRLQPDVLAARAPDARALGPRARDDARARRGEPAARDRLEPRLARRDRAALPAARPLGPRRPGRSSARSTTRRAGSSATTRSSGASRAAPTAAASRSTRTRR